MGARADAGENNALMEDAGKLVENPCPFNKAVLKTYDLEAEEITPIYYRKKNETCNPQMNAKANQWVKGAHSAGMPLPTFIKEDDEAVFFTCDEAYIAAKVDKIDTCLNTMNFCPLNVVLERTKAISDNTQEEKIAPVVSGRRRGRGTRLAPEAPPVETKKAATLPTLKNPATDMICVAPSSAKLRMIASSPVSAILECPAGYYSNTIPTSGRPDHIQCVRCPDGKTSIKGSFDAASCYKNCAGGEMVDPNDTTGNTCIACNANAAFNGDSKQCVCNQGYSGPGYGEGGCQPCPAGSYCPGGSVAETCDFSNGFYSAATGAFECRQCPAGVSVAVDATTCSCIKGGYDFNPASGLCEPSAGAPVPELVQDVNAVKEGNAANNNGGNIQVNANAPNLIVNIGVNAAQ
jgi:hypothetical protein